MSRIGIDLDNTIIDYEAIIREEVAALGILHELPAGDKRALRDALRGVLKGEERWMRVQARVYGPRLDAAPPFPGVLEFVRHASSAGHELVVVSHKTVVAAADATGYDLRAAADRWLLARGIVGPDAVPAAQVFYEDSRRKKVERIAALRLDAFVDDLAEVFAEPTFPRDVERWLFTRTPNAEDRTRVDRVFSSWEAIGRHVFGTV